MHSWRKTPINFSPHVARPLTHQVFLWQLFKRKKKLCLSAPWIWYCVTSAAHDKPCSQKILLKQEFCCLSWRAILIDIFLPRAATVGVKKITFCPVGQKWSLYHVSFLLQSDILLGLQIPFANTVTDHVFTELLVLLFQCPYATPALFPCFVHYGRAPWPVEDMQGVDSLTPAGK